jgi:hypothetical protein
VATIFEAVPGLHQTDWNAFWFPAKTTKSVARRFGAEPRELLGDNE